MTPTSMPVAICRERQPLLISAVDLGPHGAASRPHLKLSDLDARVRIWVSALIGRDNIDGEREFLAEDRAQHLRTECEPGLRTSLIDGEPHCDDFIEVEPDDRQA